MGISVVGLGKLGSPLLAVLASRGFDVCGIDLHQAVVDQINQHIAPVEEPRLQELLDAFGSRIRATTDWQDGIEGTDVTSIIVPTPSGADGAFKNDFVLSAINNVGQALRRKPGYHLVVVHSTTMPGSVGGPIKECLERASGKRVGVDLGLCYNPEFIALGNVIEGLLHPDFVLIGESDSRAGDMLADIYHRVLGPDVALARMNFVNAELAKISVNTYVTMKISFANMLSEICHGLTDADANVVTNAIGIDTRIGGKYLRSGTGYGGPCFPRDTVAFVTAGRRLGVDAALASATQVVNERQQSRLLHLVRKHASEGETIAVLGLSYKPGTPVVEESQGVLLAAALAEAGYKVVVHDPAAIEPARAVLGPGFSYAESVAQATATADVVVVMVPWTEYRDFFRNWRGSTKSRAVIDCWQVVDNETLFHDTDVIRLGVNASHEVRPLSRAAN